MRAPLSCRTDLCNGYSPKPCPPPCPSPPPMQDQLRRRDGEISRLGTRAGTDDEVINLHARNEANESMILQLNATVKGGLAGR